MQALNFISLWTTMILYTFFYVFNIRTASHERLMENTISFLSKLHFMNWIFFVFYPFDTGLKKYIINGKIGLLAGFGVGALFFTASILVAIKAGKGTKEPYDEGHENGLYGGLYRKIRHPQMLSDMLLYFGAAFFFNSVMLMLVALIWVPLYIFMAYREEADLKSRFGEAYEAYRESTGCFFPKH